MKNLYFLIIFLVYYNQINAQTKISPLPGLSDTIYCMQPVSNYYLIDDNKQYKVDSIMNIKNKDCLINGFISYFDQVSNIRIVNVDLMKDSCAVNELNTLLKYMNTHSLEIIPRMNCLDGILDSLNANYALISLSYGFTRSKENYQKSMVKGAFFSALTLGTFMTVPYESTIDLRIILINVKTRQLIKYNECHMVDSHPDLQKDIDTQIRRVFKSTFNKRK